MITHSSETGLLLKGSRRISSSTISPTDEMKSDIQEMRIHNRLSAASKLLLIFAWVSDDDLRLVRMHPEFLCIDCTHKSNRQKRDLFTIAGKDGNNNGFNPLLAFIPNQKGWVFNELFLNIIPTLWGSDTLKRVFLSLTDGDRLMIQAQHNGIDHGIWPNTVHALCFWHLFTLSWRKNVW